MLFVDQAMAAMHCMAGGKAFNGYFQYQAPEIFKLLYQAQGDSGQFRRLNHLMVTFTPPESPLFEASVPSPDVILLRFNAVKTGEHIQGYRVIRP